MPKMSAALSRTIRAPAVICGSFEGGRAQIDDNRTKQGKIRECSDTNSLFQRMQMVNIKEGSGPHWRAVSARDGIEAALIAGKCRGSLATLNEVMREPGGAQSNAAALFLRHTFLSVRREIDGNFATDFLVDGALFRRGDLILDSNPGIGRLAVHQWEAGNRGALFII